MLRQACMFLEKVFHVEIGLHVSRCTFLPVYVNFNFFYCCHLVFAIATNHVMKFLLKFYLCQENRTFQSDCSLCQRHCVIQIIFNEYQFCYVCEYIHPIRCCEYFLQNIYLCFHVLFAIQTHIKIYVGLCNDQCSSSQPALAKRLPELVFLFDYCCSEMFETLHDGSVH